MCTWIYIMLLLLINEIPSSYWRGEGKVTINTAALQNVNWRQWQEDRQPAPSNIKRTGTPKDWLGAGPNSSPELITNYANSSWGKAPIGIFEPGIPFFWYRHQDCLGDDWRIKSPSKKWIWEGLLSHPNAFNFPKKSLGSFKTSWYYDSTLSFWSLMKGKASTQRVKENHRWKHQWTGRNIAKPSSWNHRRKQRKKSVFKIYSLRFFFSVSFQEHLGLVF